MYKPNEVFWFTTTHGYCLDIRNNICRVVLERPLTPTAANKRNTKFIRKLPKLMDVPSIYTCAELSYIKKALDTYLGKSIYLMLEAVSEAANTCAGVHDINSSLSESEDEAALIWADKDSFYFLDVDGSVLAHSPPEGAAPEVVSSICNRMHSYVKSLPGFDAVEVADIHDTFSADGTVFQWLSRIQQILEDRAFVEKMKDSLWLDYTGSNVYYIDATGYIRVEGLPKRVASDVVQRVQKECATRLEGAVDCDTSYCDVDGYIRHFVDRPVFEFYEDMRQRTALARVGHKLYRVMDFKLQHSGRSDKLVVKMRLLPADRTFIEEYVNKYRDTLVECAAMVLRREQSLGNVPADATYHLLGMTIPSVEELEVAFASDRT